MQRRSQHVDIKKSCCVKRWYGVVCWLKIVVLAGHFVTKNPVKRPSSPGVFVAQW